MIATLPTPKTTYSLNILLVEDSEDDFELCLHALKNEFTPQALRVDTEAGFRAALATSEWDAILCDYSLPQFSVFEALHIVQELGIDIPFIVVSGSISEEDAVHCIKSGAHDYLIKDRLLKLPHAILREIREARGREEYRWQEKVNQQLFKELKNYITAINTSTLTTMTSLDGTIISANELFCQVSGYTEKEIIGRNESIVNSGYHTEEFWEDFWHTITNRKVWRGDIRNKAKDGSYYWVDTTVFPLVNTENDLYGFMSVRHICTDQKEAAIRIAESELRFRTLADTAPVLVWMSDTEKLITYLNKTVLEFTGRTIEQIQGYGWADIIHPDDLGKSMHAYIEAFDARRKYSVEYRLLHHTGEYRWLLDIGVPRYLPNGEFAGYMGSCVDITQRKEAEKYLMDVNEGLERRVEDRTKSLIKLNQEKNEFLGIAAHDLKNPLAGIRSSAEILLRYYIQEERAAKFIQNIIVSTDQMLDIVTNLLDVNKIESGGYEVHIRRIPLEVFDKKIENYQARAAEKAIMLSHEPIDAAILADEFALHQVFDNLISNAIKFSPKWSKVVVRMVRHLSESGEAKVRIEIQDEGPGLTEQDKLKLFSKFARLSAKPTGQESSTGLGLSIVKRLVEAMGGQVWCESEHGKGATFIVEFMEAVD